MHNEPGSSPTSLRAASLVAWIVCGLLGLGGLVLTCTPSILAQTTPSPTLPEDLSQLRARFTAHLTQPRFHQAHWGVRIVSLDTGRVIFDHQGDRLFIPASNTKLFTGALALDRLGPDFRIRTSLFGAQRPGRRGTLAGDLVLYGRGDPTLAARLHNGRLDVALEPLVDAVARAGIRTVRGDLVADASFFPGPALGSGWNWDDLPAYYGAEVSALTINDNAVEVAIRPAAVPGRPALVRVEPPTAFLVVSNQCLTAPSGTPRRLEVLRPLNQNVIFVSGQIPADDRGASEAISVHQPAAWFGHLLREALARRGIRVRGTVRTFDRTPGIVPASFPSRAVELGSIESPPLRDLLARMMKPSQNLHAQLLLLQVGAAELAARAGRAANPGLLPLESAAQTAEAAGIEALGGFLREAGIPADEVLFEEGSGLSRRHLVTPAAIVRLLEFMDRHRDAAVFRAALPLAGVDGTLRARLRDTPAANNARAKTGTLRYVNALSGYVTSVAGERFVFSLLLNNFNSVDPNRSARADLDDIVATLAGLTWRTSHRDSSQAPGRESPP